MENPPQTNPLTGSLGPDAFRTSRGFGVRLQTEFRKWLLTGGAIGGACFAAWAGHAGSASGAFECSGGAEFTGCGIEAITTVCFGDLTGRTVSARAQFEVVVFVLRAGQALFAVPGGISTGGTHDTLCTDF